MNKEFVTYEQALALKELGFDEPCLSFRYIEKNKPEEAPTYSQAFRFFREKLEVESFVRYKYELAVKSGYFFKIDHPKLFNFMDYDSKTYKTHPEAESSCLDKLIEISK